MRIAALAFCSTVACLAYAGTAEIVGYAGGGNGTYSVPVTSIKEARFKTTISQHYDYSCGSAAVATLLSHHYNFRVNEQQVFKAMYERGDQQKIRREGFSMLDMKSYLQAEGFEANGYRAPLEELEKANMPAITLIQDNGYYHFVVVKGLRGKDVLIGDPSMGTRVIPRERFEAMWKNRILFVVINKDRAAFNTAFDWRAQKKAPLDSAIYRDGLVSGTLLRRGPNDF
jgi:uncharacterized protein